MCIYGGHMWLCVPNMKFLCLTLCQGEVCTDDDDDANANANDGQSMIANGSLVDKPNELKTKKKSLKHLPRTLYQALCD